MDGNFQNTLGTTLLNTLLWFIVVLSIFGNFLVCLAIITDKLLCRRSNSLYVSLAIADLIVSTCVMTFSLIYEANHVWIYGKVFCKIYLSLDVMCSTASIIHLVAIAIERYIHISRPFFYQKFDKRRNFALIISLIWIISFCLSFLPIFLDLHVPKDANDQLSTNPSSTSNNIKMEQKQGEHCLMELSLEYGLISSTISFYLPCLMMFIIYGKLYYFARSHSNRIKTLCSPLESAGVTERTTTTKDILLSQHDSVFKKLLKPKQNGYLNRVHTDHKAAVTLGIILGVFIICWLPFFIINCVNSVCRCIDDKVFKFATWLGYCNSCLNPIIYTLFNREFRIAFIRVLLTPICCISKETKNSLLRSKTSGMSSSVIKFSKRQERTLPIDTEQSSSGT